MKTNKRQNAKTKESAYFINIEQMTRSLAKAKGHEERIKIINIHRKYLSKKRISTVMAIQLIDQGCSIMKESLEQIPLGQAESSIMVPKINKAILDTTINLSYENFSNRVIYLFLTLSEFYLDLCDEIRTAFYTQYGLINHLLLIYTIVLEEYKNQNLKSSIS